MNLTVLRDAILVADPADPADISFPLSMQRRPDRGVVVACGPGKEGFGSFLGMPVGVGDMVFFSPQAARPIEYEGENFLLLRQDDIYACKSKA